ncbi:MAG TPA: substrate-binding domain-containing protein [Cytophagaceae bacterium]|jgi:phosphate transport system substrate-binding protein|nr:substrate-binding domain-containing protein [Cytophagaceae bacterium]
MKKTTRNIRILLFAALLVVFTSATFQKKETSQYEGTISISGAFALYPLAVKWGQEYKKLHPGVTFDISAGGAGKGISDALGGMVDLGAVSRDLYPEEIKKGAFPVSVSRDAVVPTVNAGNPNIVEILSKGIKKDVFTGIFVTSSIKTWKQAGFSIAAPINVYTRSDAAGAAEVWAKYLGNKKQEDLKGTGVYGDPGLLQAVKRDKASIGFNNIGYAYDTKTKQQLAGIRVVPIDKNGNGKIDAEESFYDNIDDLRAAIAAGKYPSPPARDLFFITKNKPQKPEVVAFLKWVLTDGQKFVAESGYINLTKEKLDAEAKKLQ